MAGIHNMLLGIGSSISGGGGQTIPTNGLIARYLLKDNANDTIGSYTGTSANLTFNTEYTTFNGTNSLITTSLPQSLLGTCSFSFWINPSESTDYKGVFGDHNSGTGGIIGLQAASGAWAFGFFQGASSISINNIPIVLNTFQHVVCIMSPTSLLVYVNGVLFKQVTHSLTFTPLSNLLIGRAFNLNNRYFKGGLSNFLIYNRVLSEQEVNNIYAVGK